VQVGDRVRMSPMWKYEAAVGVIEKVTSEYIVVKWDDIPGYWHYTNEQTRRLQSID